MKFKWGPKKNKYGAIRCECDGIKFPSKLEKDCYEQLKLLKENKKILFFIRQIPFDLPSSKIHRVDFCLFSTNEVIFIECKGKDLPLGKLKREMVEHIYGIEIKVVKNLREINGLVQT
jgi:hypothetical protein